jgi:predicted HicB family RNase H-like nuclease
MSARAKRTRRTPVREYSRAFLAPSASRRRKQIAMNVPAELHKAITEKAQRTGVSVRALVLTYLQEWSEQ